MEKIAEEPARAEATTSMPRRIGAAERRSAILDCAEQVFLDEGFQATSMSAVAARLGSSKGTLYNYFQSKDELFLACVSRHCDGLKEQMSTLIADGLNLPETLTCVGQRYLSVVSSDDVVRKFRLVVAEAERSPDIARAFYATGPQAGCEILAAYLQRAMDEGLLRRAEPLETARFFFGLCDNWLSKARVCNAAPAPDRETIMRNVAEGFVFFRQPFACQRNKSKAMDCNTSTVDGGNRLLHMLENLRVCADYRVAITQKGAAERSP